VTRRLRAGSCRIGIQAPKHRKTARATAPFSSCAVFFDYWDESDGVDYSTGQGVPFYPIPAQAATQPQWMEGGDPGNIGERASSDRHLRRSALPR